MIDLQHFSFPSLGPLVIAAIAALLSVFQWQIYTKRSRDEWNLWGAVISLGTTLYAAATFVQYNAFSPLVLRVSSQVQLTMLAIIMFAVLQYSISYIRLAVKWLMPAGIAVSSLFVLLIWATDLVAGNSIETIPYLLLREPYRQAALGPLGSAFLAWISLVGISLFIVWMRSRRERRVPLTLIVSAAVWLLFGVQDALATIWPGLLSLMPLAEYGFLGYCISVLFVTLRDYVALFDLAESRQRSLEQARDEAELANRSKSEFLANMSHELRTPLNHIIGFTDLVMEESTGSLNDTQKEYLQDVAFSGRHLLSLIDDILDLSKMEAGKLEPHDSDVTLEPILDRCAVMIKEKAIKRGIAVTIDAREAPARLRTDERKLRQIVCNLLSNAVKFTPDGGQISVRAWAQDHPGPRAVLRLTVRDSGIGIENVNLERIFLPFEQVEAAGGRQSEGTGLGLSLSRRLAELLGGRIWAQSEGLGKGSAFHLVLPLREPGASGRSGGD